MTLTLARKDAYHAAGAKCVCMGMRKGEHFGSGLGIKVKFPGRPYVYHMDGPWFVEFNNEMLLIVAEETLGWIRQLKNFGANLTLGEFDDDRPFIDALDTAVSNARNDLVWRGSQSPID